MQCILTGCDSNTEWQLPWFIENYKRYCTLPLVIADFGMSADMQYQVSGFTERLLDCPRLGWFSKIDAMIMAAQSGFDEVCWLDTDCEIKSNPASIFRFVDENKLTMVKDHPWSKRRPQLGDWYNSGVVAFKGLPKILWEWKAEAATGNHVGDQEALYSMIGGDSMKKASIISEAPHRYNVLRLDFIDNNIPNNPVIVHHTGAKGNTEIRKQMSHG